MAKINLLPWREALRKELQQQFYVAMGGFVVLVLGICVAIHLANVQRITYQQSRNGLIESEIFKLDKKLEEIKLLDKEKQKLKARIESIERLQGNRPLIVRLFDEIVTSLPEGVSLTSITQKGPAITINGVAESNARVSSLMKKLDASEWLEKIVLDVIEAKDDSEKNASHFTFTLRFNQVILGEEGGDET